MENKEQIQAVTQMQRYIEDNIKTEFTLKEIADEVGYSPWYASKIFKKYTGKTVFQYIRTLRLSRAALHMRDGEDKIIDTAFEFVFESQEGFTRAFSKEFGISPKRYSKKSPPVSLFIPYPVEDYYKFLHRDEIIEKEGAKNRVIFTQIVIRERRKLLVKRGKVARDYFAYCQEIECDAWGILWSMKEGINEPMGLWLPENMRPDGTSEYVMGVELHNDFNGEIPEGFEILDMEPCEMMIFQGASYSDDDFMVEVEGAIKAIDDFDPEVYGYEYHKSIAPRFQLEPQGERGYIEGRPVRRMKENL